jgi:hypothetical protein
MIAVSVNSQYNKHDLAKSAFWILNDLMGEIHAGRIILLMAVKGPEKGKEPHYQFLKDIFSSKNLPYFYRLGYGAIAIALYKFDDLWKHHLDDLLHDSEQYKVGKKLVGQIAEMKIRRVRSTIIAHYSDNPKNPKKRDAEIQKLIDSWLSSFETEEDFYEWTNQLIQDLDTVKKALASRYRIAAIRD